VNRWLSPAFSTYATALSSCKQMELVLTKIDPFMITVIILQIQGHGLDKKMESAPATGVD
jgi:hypothetical protein